MLFRSAAVAAVGRIGGVSVVAAVLDSRFFMGSMSTAVGEQITDVYKRQRLACEGQHNSLSECIRCLPLAHSSSRMSATGRTSWSIPAT